MKYVVVNYNITDKDILSVDSFDNKQGAVDFLKEDATNMYEEQISQIPDEYIDDVSLDIDGEYACLWDRGCDYEWTWHIIEVA